MLSEKTTSISNHNASRADANATRFVLLMGGLYLFAGATLLFGNVLGARAAAAFSQSGQFVLLYVALPIVFLASLYFWLAPGLMLVLTRVRPSRLTTWVVEGFLVAFVVQVVVSTCGKVIIGSPLGNLSFLISSAFIGLISWVVLWQQRGRLAFSFLAEQNERRRSLLLLLIPTLGLCLLLPFLFWQDLNPDGVEAFFVGDSLARHLLPQSLTPGILRVGTGIIAPSYLYHAFLMFFGPIEASVRLPILLLLPVMFGQLIDLIEWDGRRRLALVHELILLSGLAIYTVVMSFNSSYDPYFADISSPTVQDTTLVMGLLGVLWGMVEKRPWAMTGFALLACFSRPTGFVFLFLLLGATLVAGREDRWAWLRLTAMALAVCVAAALFYELVLVQMTLGNEEAVAGTGRSLLNRMRYLNLTDWHRLAFLIFPSGIFPALTLFLYRRQDSLSRIVTLITVALFLFFYVIAFTALHHFVVVMVLPLIVFWRVWLVAPLRQQRFAAALAGVGALAAFWLSVPQHFEVNRDTRAVGERTLFLVGDPADGLRSVMSSSGILNEVVGYDWDVRDPASEWVGSPLGLVYYADRYGPLRPSHSYAVLPVGSNPPPGMVRLTEREDNVMYGRDPDQVHRDRFRSLNTHYMSSLYDIPRETLFSYWGKPAANYDVDVMSLLGHVRP